jgi:hypothetical protein
VSHKDAEQRLELALNNSDTATDEETPATYVYRTNNHPPGYAPAKRPPSSTFTSSYLQLQPPQGQSTEVTEANQPPAAKRPPSSTFTSSYLQLQPPQGQSTEVTEANQPPAAKRPASSAFTPSYIQLQPPQWQSTEVTEANQPPAAKRPASSAFTPSYIQLQPPQWQSTEVTVANQPPAAERSLENEEYQFLPQYRTPPATLDARETIPTQCICSQG